MWWPGLRVTGANHFGHRCLSYKELDYKHYADDALPGGIRMVCPRGVSVQLCGLRMERLHPGHSHGSVHLQEPRTLNFCRKLVGRNFEGVLLYRPRRQYRWCLGICKKHRPIRFTVGKYQRVGNCSGPPYGSASWDATAFAAASDSLIVFGAGSGFLDAEFTFPSDYLRNQGFGGFGEASVQVDLGTTHYSSLPGPYYGSFRLLVPIQFGIPTSLYMNLAGDGTGNWLTPLEISEARLNLITLHISDASMVPLSTYSYTTRSGSQYNFEGGTYVAVPDHRCCCSSAGDWDYLRSRTTGAADKWANASDSIRCLDCGL